jgi:hypothetical protein
MGLLDRGRCEYNRNSWWRAELQVGAFSCYALSFLTSYLLSIQGVFVYCGQLNALEGFAWVIWYVLLIYVYHFFVDILARILVTFAILVVLIRGIIAARRGDGMRGPLIA